MEYTDSAPEVIYVNNITSTTRPQIVYFQETPSVVMVTPPPLHSEDSFDRLLDDPLNQVFDIPNTVVPQQVLAPPSSEVKTLVFLDLETTGLGHLIGNENVHVTEITMMAISKMDFVNSQKDNLSDIRVLNKLTLCVKPRTRVSPDAAKITGLNDSNLFEQQEFDAGLGKMIESFFYRLPQPVCLVAHNGIDFDFPLLKAELQRIGINSLPNVYTADSLVFVRTSVVASIPAKKTKKNCRKGGSNSLPNLYHRLFNKRAVQAHSAEGDVITLAMVCKKLKNDFLPWMEEKKQAYTSIKTMW